MRLIQPDAIRNVALIGHGQSGKTTLADGLLWVAGAVSRRGTIEQGTSVFDYDDDEKNRRHSILLSVGYCDWRERRINLIDTPGSADFFGDTYAALRVVDGIVLVINAATGLEVQAERGFKLASEYELPCIVFINKLDAERADFEKALQEIKERLKVSPVPLFYPWGQQADFKGVIDVLSEKAYTFDADGKQSEQPLPADLQETIAAQKEAIVEVAAEGSEELTDKYLMGEELTDAEVRQGLMEAVRGGTAVPVLCGSASKNAGLQPLLDAIVDFFPPPTHREKVEGTKPGTEDSVTIKAEESAPLSALVFKTVSDPYVGRITYFRVFSGKIRSDSQVYNANQKRRERIGQLLSLQGKSLEPIGEASAGQIAAVAKLEVTHTGDTLCEEANQIILPPPHFPRTVMELAVHPKARGDEEKILSALQRLSEEDPTFRWYRHSETGETIIAGLGDLHLDVAVERVRRKFGVDVTVSLPKIPYKETIRRKARAEGRYVRQTGGRGQYGIAHIEVEPKPRGEGYEFIDAIVGGVIPQKFIPSVEKGVLEAMAEGVLAGYPVVDIKVTLYDGKHHEVDSSDIAFKLAGSIALKNAVQQAQLYLLEPIMSVEITVPEEDVGSILGDLSSRRGRPLGTEPADGMQIVKALVPLAEMQRYAADLRSMTRGRGSYWMEFSHYEEVPPHIAEQIIAKAQQEKQSTK